MSFAWLVNLVIYSDISTSDAMIIKTIGNAEYEGTLTVTRLEGEHDLDAYLRIGRDIDGRFQTMRKGNASLVSLFLIAPTIATLLFPLLLYRLATNSRQTDP